MTSPAAAYLCCNGAEGTGHHSGAGASLQKDGVFNSLGDLSLVVSQLPILPGGLSAAVEAVEAWVGGAGATCQRRMLIQLTFLEEKGLLALWRICKSQEANDSINR